MTKDAINDCVTQDTSQLATSGYEATVCHDGCATEEVPLESEANKRIDQSDQLIKSIE